MIYKMCARRKNYICLSIRLSWSVQWLWLLVVWSSRTHTVKAARGSCLCLPLLLVATIRKRGIKKYRAGLDCIST